MDNLQDIFSKLNVFQEPLHPSDKKYRELILNGVTKSRQNSLLTLSSVDTTMKVSFNNPYLLKKPSNVIPPAPEKCIPIYIKQMNMGTTHKGRILTGKIIIPIDVIVSVHCVIEDDFGDVVRVSFPNPYPTKSGMALLSALDDQYPVGGRIAVIEPFLKMCQDNFAGVRVDNPKEIIRIANGGKKEKSALNWKGEGNKLFGSLDFGAAIDCYSQGLRQAIGEDEKLGMACMENLALAYFQTEDHHSCSIFALAAYEINHQSPKATYRAATSLDKLGLKKEAFFFANLAVKNNCGEVSEKLLKSLSKHQTQNFRLDLVMDLLADWKCDRIDASSKKPLDLKQEGNVRFGQRDYSAAINLYRQALLAIPIYATLFGNRSTAYGKAGNALESCRDATMALALNPEYEKMHFRRTSAYLDLKKFEKANTVCEWGLKWFPNSEHLLGVAKSISALAKVSKRVIEEDEDIELEALRSAMAPDRGDQGMEGFQMLNSVMQMASFNPETKRKMEAMGFFIDNCPPYHTEYSTEGHWPAQCDIDECMRSLTDSYERNRCIRTTSMLEMNTNGIEEKEMLIRVGSTKAFMWYKDAKIGDVNPSPLRIAYHSKILHSYGNAEYRREVLNYGRVHVAVGFVDLGGLLNADIRGLEGPLSWYGYESSAYCVAKTTVILRMMKQQANVKSILQVWFSAAWTRQTEKEFHCALSSLTEEAIDEEVKDILTYWGGVTVPLSLSRKKWLKTRKNWGAIGNIAEKKDRIDFCTYQITGQLLDAEVGSIVMFGNPKNLGLLSTDENFLQCIPYIELLDYRKKFTSFVEAGIAFFMEKISVLSQLVASGKVVVHLRHRTVDKTIAKEICSLNPYTMSWSNVCDYFTPKDFFEIARIASEYCETVHYLYSMNWILDVMGTFLIDYHPKHRKNIVDQFSTGLEMISKNMGASKYVTFPLMTNVRNIGQCGLSCSFATKWFKEYFRHARFFDQERQALLLQAEGFFNIFSRAHTTVNMSFTFDSEVTLLQTA